MVYWLLFGKVYSTRELPKIENFGVTKMYGFELGLLQTIRLFEEIQRQFYEMTFKGAFYYHYYENFYTPYLISTRCGIMKRSISGNRLNW